MPADVSLKSILLASFPGTNVGSISFTQCTLSSGDASPLFSNENMKEQSMPKVIDFDANRKVRRVQAGNGSANIRRLTFLDKEGNEIDSYNPNNRDRSGQVHEIGENEELIGVYGVKDLDNWFNSFGFIVKVRQ